jgi:DNA-binding NtrC family response regulator
MPSMLIVDDDTVLNRTLLKLFTQNGYRVTSSTSLRDAVKRLETDIHDLVLTDLRLGADSGLDVLATAKKLNPEVEVIIMTAFGSVPSAVKAIQNGASDYITKPFKNQELLFKVNKAVEQIGLRNEVRYLRQEIAGHFGFDNIISTSRAMTELKKVAARIAGTDISVLITGESGTGKELFAKVLHHHSPRRNKPFVTINCSAIPENLLESELFGHVKGAFTSAVANKRGLFEEAEHGTIFLDEVGDLPYSIQAKMLRVLQEKEIRPVGGNVTRSIDVRVIAATNVDLINAVREGRFRDDLFYRLNVMPIHIPPLRERPEDIPPLTEYFLRKMQKEYNYRPAGLSADGMELLLKHDWPGNVRELENTLKRAMALSGKGQIRYEDIIFISSKTSRLTSEPIFSPKGQSLLENQKVQILKSLRENDWNYSMTAGQLGIGRTTLWRKMKKFNLKPPNQCVVERCQP